MTKNNIVLLTWALSILSHELYAQQKNYDSVYANTLVMLNDVMALQLNDQDTDVEGANSEINRKDINRVNLDALLGMGLNMQQSVSFLQYRKKSGGFKDIHELQAVPFWDEISIRKLRTTAYVIPEQASVKDLFRQIFQGRWQSSIRGDYEREEGVVPDGNISGGVVSGSMLPYRIRLKMNHRAAWVDWGIIGEKDAGERLAWDHEQKGLDTYQGYIRFRGLKYIRQLIIGDFKISVGQGLLIRQSPVMGMWTESMQGPAGRDVVTPHRGYDEVFFKRGLAMETEWGDFGCAWFASIRKLDGVILEDTINERRLIHAIYRSGLHTDSSSLGRRKKIKEKMAGIRFSWNKPQGNLGISAIGYDYGYAFFGSERAYARYRDSTSVRAAVGLDYSLTFLGMHAFGETCGSALGSVSMIHSLSIPVSGGLSMGLAYRNYGIAYDLPDAQVWGVQTDPQNEQGWLAQLRYQSGSKWDMMLGWDVSGSKWLRYGKSGSVQTEQYVLMLSRHWGKEHTIKWTYLGEKTTELTLKNKTSIDFRYEFNPKNGMDFKVRYWNSRYRNSEVTSVADYVSLGTDFALTKVIKAKLRLYSLESDAGAGAVYDAIPDVAGGMRYVARYGKDNGGCICLLARLNGVELGVQYGFSFKENLKINRFIQQFSIVLAVKK